MNITQIDGLLAVLSGICSISYLYFGLYIISFALKDKRLRSLFYTCIFSSVWSLSYVSYYLSADTHAKEFWQSVSYVGILTFVFLLWFFLRHARIIKNKKIERLLSFVIWIPPFFTVYKSLAGNAIAGDFPSGFWFLYMDIQIFIYNLASVIIVIIYYMRSRTNKSRRQAYILCVSGFVLMLLSWSADYFYSFRHKQNIMPFWLLIWIGILLYTIKKYRFIPITPDFISKDITENIEEGIILFTPDFKVIFTNNAARRLLNTGESRFIQLQDFVLEKHILDNEFSKLAEAGKDSFKTRINLIPGGTDQKVPADLKVKKVIDNYNDISGFLMIVARAKNIEHLKTLYKITDRELEIIYQLALGKTNKEIADFFRLTLKTVETHVSNIYGKLLVNNRIELLNILSEYNSGGQAPKRLSEP